MSADKAKAGDVEVRLRPDGTLAIGGRADEDGVLVLALAGAVGAVGESAVVVWLRRLVGDHVRRIVAASADGTMPQGAALEPCRPDALESLAILSSVPPMQGGEYWTVDVLSGVFARLESALAALSAKHGGDLLAAVASLGPGWRDVGKVSLHLAENKGDKSGTRPFAFLATFVSRADADGRTKHLPLSAALKAYAAKPAALSRILAPLEAAAKEDKFLLSLLESRRIFQPCALSVGEAYSFLKGIAGYEHAGLLVRTGRLWAKAPAKAKVSVSVGKSKGGLLNANALCDFDVDVTINGEPLSEEELALLANSREGLVRIRGEWVEADHEKIQELLAKWKDAKRLMRDGLTMAQALRMLAGGDADSLAPGGGDDDTCEVRATGELKELLQGLMHPGGRSRGTRDPTGCGFIETALPNGLDAVLRPYQKDGVEYLSRTMAAGLGACLADDMGLGKTIQVLTLIDIWKNCGEIAPLPVLIVMPASLLANWKTEAARFTPDLRVGVLHPSDAGYRGIGNREEGTGNRECGPLEEYIRRFDLVLTTYGQFTRLENLRKLPFAAVIADEAQAIKNPGSGQSKALRSVVSPRRLALTGTPVENRMSDLWSIFDFINPGLLGGLKSFQTATAKSNDFSVVRKLTRPFILRRLKTDKAIIADLPDKTEIDVSTPLSQKQALLYERTVEELRKALEDVKGEGSTMKRKGLVLAYMLRFKQICDHPSLYLGTEAWKPEDSGKFVVLGERAAEVASRQEKMLVFTQYREMTAPLAEFLSGVFGREGLILHGGTPVAARGKLVKAFQDPGGPPFFVLSVKAAGTGLNLTAANHVVHFDRWWNPAVENQASDRAYRIGQKRNVLIHKFVTYGTLEEKIDVMIKEKQALADSLFADGGEKLVTEMTDDELMDLVKLDASVVEK
jgi:non-specific serine/threonine protein kinase